MEVARAAAMNNVGAMWFEGNFKEYDLISAGGNGQMLTPHRVTYKKLVRSSSGHPDGRRKSHDGFLMAMLGETR